MCAQPLDGPGWTDQRRKLQALLADRSPLLADYYASAVYFLHRPEAPARRSHLAHAIRELCNRMPDAVNVARLDRSNTENLLPALAAAWDAAGLPDSADELPRSLSVAGVTEGYQVPRSVMVAAAELVVSTRKRGNNRRRAALMIVDSDALTATRSSKATLLSVDGSRSSAGRCPGSMPLTRTRARSPRNS